jgi:hypothetical protein
MAGAATPPPRAAWPDPCHQVVWCPPGPSPSRTLAPCVFWKNRIFAIFSGIFPKSRISAQKQDTRGNSTENSVSPC